MFRLPLWMEWLKISTAGAEVVLAQGVPGSPIHAGFAWVGVVEPWVEWEIDPSPVGAAEGSHTDSKSRALSRHLLRGFGCFFL